MGLLKSKLQSALIFCNEIQQPLKQSTFTFSLADILALPSASLEESAPTPTEHKTIEKTVNILVK